MKIGIATYFNIKNFGSALQAFAMRKTLTDRGFEVEFLNVRERSFVSKLFHKMHVAFVTLFKCLFYKEARSVQKEITALKKHTTKDLHPKTISAFDSFQRENLPSVNIGRMALRKKASTDEYAAFICGSDQIWSPLSVHLSGYKFLNFAPKDKRVAYAPSFGVSRVPKYNRSFVAKNLKNMGCISVREQEGAKIAKDLTGKTVPVVLDPTMLLDGEEWRAMYRDKVGQLECDDYILCYFFEDPDKKTAEKIVAFANERNLKIVVLFPHNEIFIKNGAKVQNAGPWEFLSLVDNAQYVFTSSFHGCAFSVLFKKAFISFGRRHSDSVKQTSRIQTLLNLVGAEASFYNEDDEGFSFPNVELFDEPMLKQRKYSLDYLNNSLKGGMLDK